MAPTPERLTFYVERVGSTSLPPTLPPGAQPPQTAPPHTSCNNHGLLGSTPFERQPFRFYPAASGAKGSVNGIVGESGHGRGFKPRAAWLAESRRRKVRKAQEKQTRRRNSDLAVTVWSN